MRRFYLAVMFVVVGCGLVWGALNFHVFRTRDRLIVAVKRSPSVADVYVDVRGWGLVEWSEFSDLAWSLVHSGHGDVVRKAAVYHTAQNIEVEASR